MKKNNLRLATIILFVLIPILALLRLFYPAPALPYGHEDITVNSVFLLLFSIYAFFVLIAHFIRCHNSWKSGLNQWKWQIALCYFLVFLFAFLLPCFMTLQAETRQEYTMTGEPYYYKTGSQAFSPDYFKEGMCIVSPAFVFPIGIVLFCLGCAAIKRKEKSKSYLIIIFTTSIIFTIIGAIPAYFVFAWWFSGGIHVA